MNQSEELQKLYDQQNEILFRLREARIIETDILSKIKLDKQIEEAQEERRKIEEEIKNLGSVEVSDTLYKALLKLGYRQQVLSFIEILETHSIGAFLIHGLRSYGQRWLLNRLVTQQSNWDTMGKMVRIQIDRRGRKIDIPALWRELGRRVGLEKQHSPKEIAERVFQWCKTQNVILVFHDVDYMPEGYLQDLLHDFWLPLASQAQEVISQTKYQLLMFLVDYEGCVGSQDMMFVEQLEPTWEPKIPIKLPTINPFCEQILTDWIGTLKIEFRTLPLVKATLINEIGKLVKEILEKSENGIPERAFEEICERCDCDWYDEEQGWLKF